ncbi:hypothetical protein ALP8811_00088 [Aliiroseovarius pelagivivens]|uniref:Peptidase inhibitor I78 family protein n=1 Tax=Aliiroseovarius pelagivivens TaxID=1639690 RepID=A0A2R8AGZ5_9RHOB|nr:I78 family peptidase inhibitor [Aliiroseovarius pelagivivens]SPF75104.1 hypothetical protein ALP8811_00088 [Aliiroseovarius pelagivivens]
MKQYFLAMIFATLSGCVANSGQEPHGSCGAGDLMYLVGQNAEVLTDLDLPENRRVLQPGMAYTMDYQPDRLNISIDENGLIDRIWCS